MKNVIQLTGLSVLYMTCGAGLAQTTVVALSGELAPASSPSIFEVFYTPAINASGDIAFTAFIDSDPGSSSSELEEGIWSTSNGSLELVQRERLSAPGTGGVPYVGFEKRPRIGDDGDVSFFGTIYVDDGTINSRNNNGLWQGRAGSTDLLAREGEPAPGAGGGVFIQLGEEFTYIGASHLLVAGRLAEGVGGVTIDDDRGLWKQTSAGLEIVHREGDIAPGTNNAFGNFNDLVSNTNGDFAFLSTIRPSSGTQNGIWKNSDGISQLIARTGSIAPGTDGQRFYQFTVGSISYDDRMAMNASGALAFKGRLDTQSQGVNSSNDTGIWSDHGGELELIVRESQPAPGSSGAVFSDFRASSISMNDMGTIAFNNFLSGGDINIGTNTALYSGDKDGVELIAREGDVVPGSPGSEFRSFKAGSYQLADEYQIGINNRNDIAFIADVRHAGSTRDSQGLWAYSALLDEIVLIAVEDRLFDVSPEQNGSMMRMVGAIRFDAETGFNDAGQLTYQLDFLDGTEGVFVTTVPAPGVMSLGFLVGFYTGRRRCSRAF